MKRALTAMVLALAPTTAAAWSNQGHMATGAIAFDDVSRASPQAVDAIVAIMAHHPDRGRFDKALAGLKGPARTRRLFELMARWPDDARETSWDRPKWHYYTRVVTGWTGIGLAVGQADRAFEQNLAIASNPRATPQDRAVALCWLFHITGDMHQPLHAGHRMDLRWYGTDRLGTIAWVRRSADEIETPLHQLWDRSLDQPGDEAMYAERLAAAAEAMPLTPSQTFVSTNAVHDFALWSAESLALARRRAYQPGVLEATRDPAAAPVVPQSYQAAMRGLAIVRVAQAGHRLGALLGRVFAGQ